MPLLQGHFFCFAKGVGAAATGKIDAAAVTIFRQKTPEGTLAMPRRPRGSFVVLGSIHNMAAAQLLFGLAVVQYELGHFGGRAGIVAVCKVGGQCQVSTGIGEGVVISCIRPLIGSQ